MRPIQMVDTKTQYQKIKSEVDQAVLDVMNSSAFINGQPVRDFTAALSSYLSVKHVIPCANGTDALQIAMMALDLQPGDEVITPSFTYIATTEVIALLRLKPVFCRSRSADLLYGSGFTKKCHYTTYKSNRASSSLRSGGAYGRNYESGS